MKNLNINLKAALAAIAIMSCIGFTRAEVTVLGWPGGPEKNSTESNGKTI